MALKDLFKRGAKVDTQDPLGLAPDAEPLPTGDGGASFYAKELSTLRWINEQQSIEAARRAIDPEGWPGAQPAFDHERALAHGHEALRDQLATLVLDKLRTTLNQLFGVMGQVVSAGEQLHQAKAELEICDQHRERVQAEVDADSHEASRYYRIRSAPTKFVKYLIIGIIVASEVLISGRVFEKGMRLPYPGLGYLFGAGLITIFIVIPHYAAQGIKEGITQRNIAIKKGDVQAQNRIKNEVADDRGFRWASFGLIVVLLVLMVPLSKLRATDGFKGWIGFSFFFLLQVGVSGYFFLREWLDHGAASTSLAKLDERHLQLSDAFTEANDRMINTMIDFHAFSTDVVTLVQQAPRWDSYITSMYLETLRNGRHLMLQEKPELGPFITYARTPGLTSAEAAGHSKYPLDPTSAEHPELDSDDMFGRRWWQLLAEKALREVDPDFVDATDGDETWLFPLNPDKLLAAFRRRCYAAGAIPPPDLDDPDDAERVTDEALDPPARPLRSIEPPPTGTERPADGPP
jgi:hypothetical protein